MAPVRGNCAIKQLAQPAEFSTIDFSPIGSGVCRVWDMNQRIALLLVVLAALICPQRSANAYPVPSKYPVSWELKFEYERPRRIVVEVPGESVPKAYWYLPFTVINKTDQDVNFLPVFEMVSKSGKVARSDRNIPKAVFDRVKNAIGNKLLEPMISVAGKLHVGEDQAKDSVAIWEEPEAEMGSFSLFIRGLSGESVELKDDAGTAINDKDGKPIILFKTMQLDYTVSGDEVYAGNDPVKNVKQSWVMR
jgi:hypothetical protein